MHCAVRCVSPPQLYDSESNNYIHCMVATGDELLRRCQPDEISAGIRRSVDVTSCTHYSGPLGINFAKKKKNTKYKNIKIRKEKFPLPRYSADLISLYLLPTTQKSLVKYTVVFDDLEFYIWLRWKQKNHK